MSGKDTGLTHSGRMSAAHFGVVNTPVYRASTILFPDYASLKANKAPYTYGRRGTPTTRSLDDAICALEGGARTVSVPSGLNAIAVAILTACRAGSHILVADSVYAPTRAMLERTLNRFGVEVGYYDPALRDVTPLFRPDTAAVFVESPGSLTFEVQDIPAIAAQAHARGIAVLMDNTWATPLYFAAIAHGVDLSIQAVTKYIGGHADVMLGTVTANDAFAARLYETHGNLGLYASGDDCFLALRGLRTLSVRLERHQQTGLALAHWLAARPEVARVLHPALPGDPGHDIWKRDFTGACGLFGVALRPVPEPALAAFFDGLSQFGIGYSWGGYESLIVPADLRQRAVPFDAPGPVIRVHAGLEDAADLIADLDAALARMNKAA